MFVAIGRNDDHLIGWVQFYVIFNFCGELCYIYFSYLAVCDNKEFQFTSFQSLRENKGIYIAHTDEYVLMYGLLTRYVKLRVVHAPGMPGTFSSASSGATLPREWAKWAGHVGRAIWTSRYYGILYSIIAVIYGMETDRFVSRITIIQVICHHWHFSQQSFAIMYAYSYMCSINLSVIHIYDICGRWSAHINN